MRSVFSLGRRALDLAVLFLAVYVLAVVPLGRHTGLEHLRAILGTKAARDAGHELGVAAQRLGRRLLGERNPTPPRVKSDARPRRDPTNLSVAPGAFEGPDAGAR